MAMHLTTTKKSTEQIVNRLNAIMLPNQFITDARQTAIDAIKQYEGFLAELHQEIKEADQVAYSSREGTATQGKWVARGIALEGCRQSILAARKALLEHFNICGSCFGQGQEAGWTCPVCVGSTQAAAKDGPHWYCAWCRNHFVGATEAQTYCVNCQKHAPSAKAAGLPEMEWRKIAVDSSAPLGTYRFCKQAECSACGGKGYFFSFVDSNDRPLPEGQSVKVQCGYCYPADAEPSTEPEAPVQPCWACRGAGGDWHSDKLGCFWAPCKECHPKEAAQKEGEEVNTDDRYWADEGRVDKPAITVAWQGNQIKITGPAATYQGIPAYVPSGDKEYTYNGWAFDWLGVVPVGQSYRVVMISTGEVLGTFSSDLEVAQFIYTTLQGGLVSTLYAEPEAPAVVAKEPQLPDRANQFITRLEAVEAKLDRVLGLLDPIATLFAAERTALEAQVQAHGEAIGENTGAVMRLRDLLAELTPAVKAANVTIGPKPTEAQATALAAVEAAVEAAEADPTEPCKALGCINGMIALGQKCPVCSGTGRVPKRAICWACQEDLTCYPCFEKIYLPVPFSCPNCKYPIGCAECYTVQIEKCRLCSKVFVPDTIHRTICPECRSVEAKAIKAAAKLIAQQAEPSTSLSSEFGEEEMQAHAEWLKAKLLEPSGTEDTDWVAWAKERLAHYAELEARFAPKEAEPSTTDPEEEPQPPTYTAPMMLAMFDDPDKGRNWIEWAVWVLGNRQTDEELAANGTIYENGVGFNGADSPYGTSLYKWLSDTRYTQPHLTAKQLEAAKRLLKKYVATQLLPALQVEAWGGPHIASSFKRGDWVEVTTWADEAKGPFRVEGHNWLNLWLMGEKGNPAVARWFDCALVVGERAVEATTAPTDGLEDMDL